jgi:hypothetical protein
MIQIEREELSGIQVEEDWWPKSHGLFIQAIKADSLSHQI